MCFFIVCGHTFSSSSAAAHKTQLDSTSTKKFADETINFFFCSLSASSILVV